MKIKQEYLKRVKKILKSNKVKNIDEILSDINELFDAKIAEGKSIQTIIAELGRPENIVKQYIGEENIGKNKKLSKLKLIFIGICTFLFLSFTCSAVLIGTGTFDVSIIDIYDSNIVLSVYLKSSETQFDSENISITLKNVSEEDFEDQIVHLMYLDAAKQPVGAAYSEQKVVTIAANDETTITFTNPGWEYSVYNEIYACYKVQNENSTWTTIKNGREFENYRNSLNTPKLYLTIIESTFALAFLIADIILIVNIKKNKNEYYNN